MPQASGQICTWFLQHLQKTRKLKKFPSKLIVLENPFQLRFEQKLCFETALNCWNSVIHTCQISWKYPIHATMDHFTWSVSWEIPSIQWILPNHTHAKYFFALLMEEIFLTTIYMVYISFSAVAVSLHTREGSLYIFLFVATSQSRSFFYWQLIHIYHNTTQV